MGPAQSRGKKVTRGKRRLEDLQSSSSPELVSQYKEAAGQRGRALLNGDTKAGNRAFDITEQVWVELSRRDSLGDLRTLLFDEDSGVRLGAASKLVEICPDEAVQVLRDLSAQKTLIGLSAAAALEAQRRYGR